MFAALVVDIVGAEGAGVVDDKVFEKGGAAGEGQIGPTKGVAGHVVAHADVEAFEKGDFADASDSVFGVGNFHFEVVSDVEGDASGLAVGGATIEALLKDGVAMGVAGVVGI